MCGRQGDITTLAAKERVNDKSQSEIYGGMTCLVLQTIAILPWACPKFYVSWIVLREFINIWKCLEFGLSNFENLILLIVNIC